VRRFACRVSTTIACLGLWACSSPANGGMIAMPAPGPVRVANSDAVIVGRVEGIEPQDLKVGNFMYRIAVVRIEQPVRGIKNAKTLRIGFIPPPLPPVGGKGPFVVRSGPRDVQLEPGQEGLFLLKNRPKDGFYIVGGPIGFFVGRTKDEGFDKEVAVVKAVAKIADNPQASLKARDADQRLLAAALLIGQYRTFRGPGQPKQVPIDAEESKLILQTLADADWQARADFRSLRANAPQLFSQLGITARDGFTPAPGGNITAASQKWLRDNAQTYRIQRYVAGEVKK
jgi:hypothetical protein